MLFWFAGGACVVVWTVFHDPAIDYRLVIGGALIPDVIDAPFGGARLMHTLIASASVMAAVMLATHGRRRLRRSLLAVPIGMFLHLVLDGAWANSQVFWWPFRGTSFGGAPLPSLDHPVAVVAVEELLGLAALAWGVWRFRLYESARRSLFLRTGHLGRDLAAR